MTTRPVILGFLDANQGAPDDAPLHPSVTIGHVRELWRAFDAMEHERDDIAAQLTGARLQLAALGDAGALHRLAYSSGWTVDHDETAVEWLAQNERAAREKVDRADAALSLANIEAGRAQGEAETLRLLLAEARAARERAEATLAASWRVFGEVRLALVGLDRRKVGTFQRVIEAAEGLKKFTLGAARDAGAALLAERDRYRDQADDMLRRFKCAVAETGEAKAEVERLRVLAADARAVLAETGACLDTWAAIADAARKKAASLTRALESLRTAALEAEMERRRIVGDVPLEPRPVTAEERACLDAAGVRVPRECRVDGSDLVTPRLGMAGLYPFLNEHQEHIARGVLARCREREARPEPPREAPAGLDVLGTARVNLTGSRPMTPPFLPGEVDAPAAPIREAGPAVADAARRYGDALPVRAYPYLVTRGREVGERRTRDALAQFSIAEDQVAQAAHWALCDAWQLAFDAANDGEEAADVADWLAAFAGLDTMGPARRMMPKREAPAPAGTYRCESCQSLNPGPAVDDEAMRQARGRIEAAASEADNEAVRLAGIEDGLVAQGRAEGYRGALRLLDAGRGAEAVDADA